MISHSVFSKIHKHHREGRTISDIARLLSISRNTVRKYLKKSAYVVPFRPRTDARRFLCSNKNMVKDLFIVHKGKCAPLVRTIKNKYGIEVNLRMLERFCKEFKDDEELKKNIKNKHNSFETKPGDQMQIDFGEELVVINGIETIIHFIVCIMSYSRRIFVKAFSRETQAAWLNGIECAIRYYNGAPSTIVTDNSKCLVKNHYAIEEEFRFTEGFLFYCRHYDMHPIATGVARPRSKGKVERAVRYVKENALVGVTFKSLEDCNIWLENWCRESDQRKVSSILEGEKQPCKRWEVEAKELTSIEKIPPIRGIFFELRKVSKEGLIRIDNRLYRVNDEFIGKEVQVQYDDSHITVIYGETVIELDKAKDVHTTRVQPASNRRKKSEEPSKMETASTDNEDKRDFLNISNKLGRSSAQLERLVNWKSTGAA